MFKKLVKSAVVIGVSYAIYHKVNELSKNYVQVVDIDTKDILEMLKERDFKALVLNDDKALHLIKDDKSEAIQVRVNEDNDVYLIEYYIKDELGSVLENVYPQIVVLDKDDAKMARRNYLNILGSMGVSEERFIKFAKEILSNKQLADLTI